MLLKFVMLLSLLTVVSSTPNDFLMSFIQRLGDYASKCFEIVGANEDDFSDLLKRIIPERKEGKCLMACIGKMFDWMIEGKVSKNGFFTLLEPVKDDLSADTYTKYVKEVDRCFDEVEKSGVQDKCELAINMAQCVHNSGVETDILSELL